MEPPAAGLFDIISIAILDIYLYSETRD